MVRSAAALAAVLILSGFALAQQVATHTVVEGDTLWGLAQRYYQNPFDWRRIWEANRDKVADPNLIVPGLVLTIPDRDAPAAVSQVEVQAPGDPEPAPQGPIGSQRTVFYQDTSVMRAGVVRAEQVRWVPVPRDLVIAAPWLVALGQEPASLGTLDGFAGGANPSRTARSYDRVHLTFPGEAPAAGTQLITFRVTRTLDRVGQVATPTGVVAVTESQGGEAVAVVTREFDRVTLGDLLGPLPAFAVQAGQEPQPVSGGGEAMVLGFSLGAELQDLGSVAFLDQGAEHGVALGDEYEYVNRLAGRDVVEGRLQVVGVSSQTSAARIVGLTGDVFRPGMVVRLARRLR